MLGCWKINYKTIFLYSFAVMLLSRILVLTNNYNWPVNPVLIEVIYLGMCIFVSLGHMRGRIKIIKGSIGWIFTGLLLHTILWGKVFVNNSFLELIESQFKSQIIFLVIIIATTLLVKEFDAIEDFLTVSFFVLAMVLLVQLILNISEFDLSNLANIMSKDRRTRANFGFGHYNMLGAACVCIIILGRFIKKDLRLKMKIIVNFFMMIALVMLLCSASRSSITSLLVYFIIYYTIGLDEMGISRKLILLLKICRFLTIGGIMLYAFLGFNIQDFLIESQRFLLFKHALPVFLESGRIMFGLGFASNTAYGTGATPYQTYWLDNTYIYYLITTGIVGFSVILIIGIILFYKLFEKRNTKYGKEAFSLYVVYLYVALFEVILFVSGWLMNYIYIPYLLMCVLNRKDRYE